MRRGTFWMNGKELVARRHTDEQIHIVRNAAWGDDYLVQCRRGPVGRHYVPWCETQAGKDSLPRSPVIATADALFGALGFRRVE